MNDYDKLVELYKNGGNIREAISDRKERNSFLKRLRDEGINENNRLKEDFRKIIAMRDGNGVSRAQISQELNINYNTIKTACSKYGSAVKNKANHPQKYKKLDKNLDLSTCPSCNSGLKEMDILMDDSFPEAFTSKTYYCFECGEEFFNFNGDTYYIDWAFID